MYPISKCSTYKFPINELGLASAIFGKNNKKNRFNNRLTTTFPILIAAYIMGRWFARSLENGTMTKASSTKIQIE